MPSKVLKRIFEIKAENLKYDIRAAWSAHEVQYFQFTFNSS